MRARLPTESWCVCVWEDEEAYVGMRWVTPVCVTYGELWIVWFAAYPSGPLEHLSVDDSQFLLLQAVLQVFGPAAVVDEDGQQDHGSLEEEVQRRAEVEEEEGEGGDQDGGDLTRQHVEHVVSELQDEGHG